jgi:hypothetical protein
MKTEKARAFFINFQDSPTGSPIPVKWDWLEDVLWSGYKFSAKHIHDSFKKCTPLAPRATENVILLGSQTIRTCRCWYAPAAAPAPYVWLPLCLQLLQFLSPTTSNSPVIQVSSNCLPRVTQSYRCGLPIVLQVVVFGLSPRCLKIVFQLPSTIPICLPELAFQLSQVSSIRRPIVSQLSFRCCFPLVTYSAFLPDRIFKILN